MSDYRKPTAKEKEKLEKARGLTVQGIEGEKDFLSKISTTAAKAARDDIRAGKALRESVPAAAREGEAYESAGYRKGGGVKAMNIGGLGRDQQVGIDRAQALLIGVAQVLLAIAVALVPPAVLCAQATAAAPVAADPLDPGDRAIGWWWNYAYVAGFGGQRRGQAHERDGNQRGFRPRHGVLPRLRSLFAT